MRIKFNRMNATIRESDRKLVNFIKLRWNLLTALVVVTLCIWGSATGHDWFVAGILVVGAISYFLGILMAMLGGTLFTIVEYSVSMPIHLNWTVLFLEATGYTLIIWLGYQHKEQKEIQLEQQQQYQSSHSPQMLSWNVTNEVRTSLAAVRFLLFPLHGHEDETDGTLEKASAELSRLEHLFREMEDEKLRDTQDIHNHDRKIH